MRLILKYIRPYIVLALLAPISILAEVWAELAQPDLMASIVDQGILGGDADVIMPTCLKMLAIMLLGVAGGIFSIYAAGRVSYAMGADLRADVYARVSRLAFADIDRLEVSSLITRMGDDVTRVQQVVQSSMRLLFRAPLLFFGAVVMALLIDVRVSVIIVSVMLASFFFMLSLMRWAFPRFVALQSRRDGLAAVLREVLVGVRVAKAYTNEQLELNRFEVENRGLTLQSIAVGRAMSWLMPVITFALNAAVVLVIYFGAAEVGTGAMGVGGIMAAISYLAQIQIAIMMASHVIISVTQARASIARIAEILATPTESERDAQSSYGLPSKPVSPGALHFRDVSFSYPADSSAFLLSHVSFSLPEGATMAIMGETGSGKSTIVNLIARFYDPTQGSISIGDADLRSIVRNDLHAHVAVVRQSPTLFAGTIRQNLLMACPDASDDDIRQALTDASLADFVNSLPQGLDSRVEQGGRNLSGGQRQRLCIARAIVSRPDILVLDDSLSALDATTESHVRASLARLRCTKVIVTQRVSTAMRASIILMLNAGHVEALGSHADLLASCSTYRDIFDAQSS